ncbi:hypothetical protein BJV74DRAFT_871323 [Russula compacta]|nr:hypothetical protein BJV74DRAFT_871323 [Russula compacta]
MNAEDIVLVGSIRETVRSHVLTVASGGIGDCIEAWRSGKPWQRPAEALPAPTASCPEPVRAEKDPIPQPGFDAGIIATQGDNAKLDVVMAQPVLRQ